MREGRPFFFKFPECFPRLQKLEIYFPHLKFELSFGDEKKLNYSKMFPALKSLSLGFGRFEREKWKLENFWRTFFPKQVCKSVTFLRMRFETLYSEYLRDEGIDEFWYKEMFPNAKIKDLDTDDLWFL